MFCSTMIYVFTQRECWSFVRVGVRFALDVRDTGCGRDLAQHLGFNAMGRHRYRYSRWCTNVAPRFAGRSSTLVAAKLTLELAVFRHLSLRRMTPLKRSALLMTGDLSNATLARFALGVLGGVILPLLLVGEAATLSGGAGLVQFVVLTGLLFAACLAGELLERYLFFTACAAPQMPGGIR